MAGVSSTPGVLVHKSIALIANAKRTGGSVQGEIKALNDILNRTGYEHEEQGGAYIDPGHGYLSDEHEVVEYRDMVVIVRDRVQALIKAGAACSSRPFTTASSDNRPRRQRICCSG